MASKQQKDLCSECKAKATHYCVQDNANFCDQHNTAAHTLRSQKFHKIIPIGEKEVILRSELVKPLNCPSHNMPLCLYCLKCKDVCCIVCLTVDNHKQHSQQVKSIVSVVAEEKQILSEYVEAVQSLRSVFVNKLNELSQTLKDLDTSASKVNQEIDRAFEQVVSCVEARRTLLKKQVQENAETYRNHIHSRQEDLKNFNVALQKCSDDGKHVLTLNEFAALTHSKTIIDKIKQLEREGAEFRNEEHLPHSFSFHMAVQATLKNINTLGILGDIPVPKFIQHKCKVNETSIFVEWEVLEELQSSITAYILELGQDNNNFYQIYRGCDTKRHLQCLKRSTTYTLSLRACCEEQIGNPALLSLRTLDFDNWILSMSSHYTGLHAENTRESLLDGHFTTGAATACSNYEWIKATFPYPVPVTSVTIGPLHKNPKAWGPTNGTYGTLQYSHDDYNWTIIGTIVHIEMQQQTFKFSEITAQYWRLFHHSYLGTSCFTFT